MMKQIYSFCLFVAFSLLLCACTDEQLIEVPNQDGAKEGELVDALFSISLDDFQVNLQGGARAITEEEKNGTDAERRVDNIWIFQFNASGQHLHTVFLSKEVLAANSLSDLPVKLVANNPGSKSIIYAVANAGETWASETEIISLDGLEQRAFSNAISGPQVMSDELLIPMVGRIKETVFVSTGSKVEVPVTRIFAKLMITVTSIESMTLKSLEVANILQSCQVQSLLSESTQKTGVTYTDVFWTNRVFGESNPVSSNSQFVLYVPENIHGIKTLEENETKNDVAPSRALALNLLFNCEMAEEEDDSFYQGFTEERSYTVYPGEELEGDAKDESFNIKRNYIYNIKVNVKAFEPERGEPSSNCFVVPTGGSIAFEPYYRIENGGGYKIEDYLDETIPDRKIEKVDIIWQYQNTIGDNTNAERVRYNSDTKKIYVKTQNPGNALIGAYNAKGDIIWSWHIWVTRPGHDPANLNSQLKYNTYAWDIDGIRYDEPRVEGRSIMACNLGALADRPTDDRDTDPFGMLYQWGRKDPFPPIRHYTGHMSKATYCESDTRYSQTAGIGSLYDNSNQNKIGITSEYNVNSLFHSLPGNGRSGLAGDDPIRYAVQHPTVFMCGTKKAEDMPETGETALNDPNNYSFNGNWANLKKSDGVTPMDDLWGGKSPQESSKYLLINLNANPRAGIANNYEGTTKSIFDPCPKGWRVPPGDLWLGFTWNGLNPNNLFTLEEQVNFDQAASYPMNGMSMYVYVDNDNPDNDVTSYFPTQGTRTPDGWVNQVGQCGNYHNGTTDVGERVNILHVHQSTEYFKVFEFTWYFYYVKSVGGPIRCVRDSDTI